VRRHPRLPDPQPFPFFRAALWDDLLRASGRGRGGQYDWVYCTDVLEHLPPQFTMLAVEQMIRVATQGVFLTVTPSRTSSASGWAGAPPDRPALRVVAGQPPGTGELVDARDMIGNALFVIWRPYE